MADRLVWYSINASLKAAEQPPVTLAEALEIAKKYYANRNKKYASAETSTMETFFGFMRSKETFIEISIDGPESISYKFEMPMSEEPAKSWWKKIFSPLCQKEATLHSWNELEIKITEFFTEAPEDIRRRLMQK